MKGYRDIGIWFKDIKIYLAVILLLLISLLLSCLNNSYEAPNQKLLFEFKSTEEAGIDFVNQLSPSASNNIFNYNYYYNGGGVAIADFNNDGLDDIFFTGNEVSCQLYLNLGDWKFKNITIDANVGTKVWVTGVSAIDINSDGWQDLYLSVAGISSDEERANLLFINKGVNENGIPLFVESAVDYGIADQSYSTHSAFFDYDMDGDLDLYLVNHWHDMYNPNYPKKKVLDGSAPSTDKLYKNIGNNKFVDVSDEAGILAEGYGLSISILDSNNDGYPDIYIANDFVYDDLLYKNNGNGTFTEIASEVFDQTSQFSMGSDAADINNDGLFDIITLDMLPKDRYRQKMMSQSMNQDRFEMMLNLGYNHQHSRNMLHLNQGEIENGKYKFSEVGQFTDMFQTDWSWSVLSADFNHDTHQDLYITNGIPHDITNKDFINFRESQIQNTQSNRETLIDNLRKELVNLPKVDPSNYMFLGDIGVSFKDKTNELGIFKKSISNGAAYADLDNDGDLDIVVNNLNSSPFLIENKKGKDLGNYLTVSLKGSNQNLDGIGARIELKPETGGTYHRENHRTRGFQSSQPEYVHFGLGLDTLISELCVRWPDGKYQVLKNITANQNIEVFWNDSLQSYLKPKMKRRLFKDITEEIGVSFEHIENEFPDFKSDPLIPIRLSSYGPKVAVGDINNDGNEDIVISGSAGNSGVVLFQSDNGNFRETVLPDGGFEDAGIHLFDADNDGDLDLYVVSGGVEYVKNTKNYQDRLYSNDGHGNFRLQINALPQILASGSCVISSDYDNDGDLDLFIGGASVPGEYPKSGKSLLLRNDSHNGIIKFSEVRDDFSNQLNNIGIVQDAIWADYNNDNWDDLIIVGQWMPILFFKNVKGKLILENQIFIDDKEKINSSSDFTGWWRTISVIDLDKDGDLDFIIGNYGLNNSFNVNYQKPLGIVAHDFDNNGKIEPIFNYYQNDTLITLFGRDEITNALPQLKKSYPNYHSFSKGKFHDIFPNAITKNAIKLNTTIYSSIILKKVKTNTYEISGLPEMAQYGPIKDILVEDFDNDQNEEIILIGNEISNHYRFGNQSALGLVFIKNNKGLFESVPSSKSGLSINKQGGSLNIITINGKKVLITLENNGSLKFFEYQGVE